MSDDSVEQPSLVGRDLFVSPVYQKGKRNLDENDTFMSWLRANSLGPFSHFGSDHNRKEYLFQGREGVLCQIASTIIEEKGAESICFGDNFIGPYRRVVRVRYMPSQEGIPSELEAGFTERGYVLGNEEEHGFVLNTVKSFRPFGCEI